MKSKLIVTILTLIAILLVFSQTAFAHGMTQVGDYEIEIGFHNEPALQGMPNGLDLFVTNSKTGDKVNGLEATLKAELIFGSSKKELEIEPQEEIDGAYTAFVIPTELGDYTWHIFGTIEDTPVDISMTSSPDTFGSVEPASNYSFPGSEASSAAVAASASAASSAQTALVVSVVAAILGLVALILGILAYSAARKGSA